MQIPIGIMIKRARQHRAMTQKELEKQTGINQGEISRIEADKAQATSEQIETIAKALKAPELLFMACTECRIAKSIQEFYGLPTGDDQFLQLLCDELQAVHAELETWKKPSSKATSKARLRQLAEIKNRLMRHSLIVRAISHLLGQQMQ